MESKAGELELMQGIARGEPAPFRIVYEAHKRRVYGICLRLMGDGPKAEEMTQEVWIKVVKSADKYQPLASLAAWLCQVTRNHCLNELRRNRPEDFTENWEQISESQVDHDEPRFEPADIEQMTQAFEQLPAQQRAALMMFVYEELSQSEIAVQLSLSVGAVKQLLHRAKSSLRLQLGNKT